MAIDKPLVSSPFERLFRLAAYTAIAAYAAILAIQGPANVLGDDAAITFRYVERLASGHGFTYNDHERVQGASNPLYALALAAIVAAGSHVESSARALAAVLLAASAVLAAILAREFSGSNFGLVAGCLLPTSFFFKYHSLSGMESALAVCLALLVVLELTRGHEALAGIFLGLAIWNKLDAALLAVAIAVTWVVIRRRLPLTIAVVSALVAAPWFVFAWWYFGTPLPHSLATKLDDGHHQAFNHLWVIGFHRWESRWAYLLMALAAFAFWRRWSETQKLGAMTLGLWFVLHAAALSAVPLGDYFPWYLTVLVPAPVIFASALPVFVWRSHVPSWLRLSLAAGAVTALGLVASVQARVTYDDLRAGNPLKPWEAFDNDRRMAGIFLSQYADPREVVESGFGWPAFEVSNPFNDASRLNTERFLEPVAYQVIHGAPYQSGSVPPQAPRGYIRLAAFNLASHISPGWSWFTVFGRPDSRVAKTGQRLVRLRLFELDRPAPFSPDRAMARVTPSSTDLEANPPSGATYAVQTDGEPLTLVFVPAVEQGDSQEVPAGVTFEVRDQRGETIYRQWITAGERRDPIAVRVSDDKAATRVSFSLLTSTPSAPGRGRPLARWRDIEVVIGDASLDLARLRNPKVADEWRRWNPPPTLVR